MRCGEVVGATQFTLPPYVNLQNPPPETLGNPGDILVRGVGALGTPGYLTYIPSANVNQGRGTVGAEVNVGQVLRYDEFSRLVPYFQSPLPANPPPSVGIALTSAVSGEVSFLHTGQHEAGWSFAPGLTLWVGADSYPTHIPPTGAVILNCGYSIRNGFIWFEEDHPILNGV